jgi:imidazole glycerol-phosphate synthase subunit HisF
MLKKRIVANLVVRNGIVVQSIGFKRYLPIGKPAIAIEFLNQWGIDEIILTDISASQEGRGPDFKLIREATKKCFVPLTIGGGISNTQQIKELMQCGADKIALNRSVLIKPKLISEAAHIFGNQCVVVSIDGIQTPNGYRVYDYINHVVTEYDPGSLAHFAEELGSGEIFIHSVDRDGSYTGYDHALINEVCSCVSIPVIASGGAKNAAHMQALLNETNASAASAANFFHFFEHSVIITKSQLAKNIDVRLETHASYSDSLVDDKMRLLKKEDEVLEHLLYTRIMKEII